MGPPSYMPSVLDRNVVMRLVPVLNGHRLLFRILTLLASCSKDLRQIYSASYAFPILLSALSMFLISPPDAHEKWYTYQIICKRM